jgi:hypothetical protein
MKPAVTALAMALVVTALTAAPSEARTHRHRYCTAYLHYDYSQSNALSPLSIIIPAANWGPFFQCQLYYGPALYLPAPY